MLGSGSKSSSTALKMQILASKTSSPSIARIVESVYVNLGRELLLSCKIYIRANAANTHKHTHRAHHKSVEFKQYASQMDGLTKRTVHGSLQTIYKKRINDVDEREQFCICIFVLWLCDVPDCQVCDIFFRLFFSSNMTQTNARLRVKLRKKNIPSVIIIRNLKAYVHDDFYSIE